MNRSKLHRISWITCLCFSLLFMGGCGQEKYNQRLEATKAVFTYINKLNEHLGKSWSQSGIEIRMPKQMTEVPPPPMQRNEDGELEVVGEDLRYPDFLSEEDLPGLVGSFIADVEADVAGELKMVPAYAFVMSNDALWIQGDREAAMEFNNTVAEAVVNGLSLPIYDPGDWKQKSYPPTPGLVPQQTASVWVTKTEHFIGETKVWVSLHLFQNGDKTVYVLFIYPETTSSRERFSERIDLALETLKISSDRGGTSTATPQGGAAGGAPGPAPGGF